MEQYLCCKPLQPISNIDSDPNLFWYVSTSSESENLYSMIQMDTSIMKSKAKKPEPIPTAELMKIKELEKEVGGLEAKTEMLICHKRDSYH